MCQRLCVGVDGVGFLIPFRVEVSLSSAHLVRFDQADINRLGDQDTSYYIMLHLQEKKAGSLKRSRSLLDLYRGVYVIICVIICCIIICYIICFFHFFLYAWLCTVCCFQGLHHLALLHANSYLGCSRRCH